MKSVTVWINDNPSRLGPSATMHDLRLHAARLSSCIAKRFECECYVGIEPCDWTSSNDEEVAAYLAELEASEEWASLRDIRSAPNGRALAYPLPLEPHRVVHIKGVEVYRVEDGGRSAYRFVDLERNAVWTTRRCVLLDIDGLSIDELDLPVWGPHGCDEEVGVAFVGVGLDEELPERMVLWDSKEEA